jgi:cation diffusion facilitator family transporter
VESENTYIEEQQKAAKINRRVASSMLFGNIALTILKAVFGFVFFNMAMLSDAAHSGMDSITTLLVIFAVIFSKPHSDKQHNYGHEKREAIFILLLSLLMLATAVLLFTQGVRGLVNVSEAVMSIPLIVVAAVSIVAKEGMYQFTNYHAKKTKSHALRADALGHRLDCVTSIAVLAGLVATIWTGNDIVESIAVLIVALFIVKIAFQVFKGAYNQLIDKSASEDDQQAIEQMAKEIEGVLCVDKLSTRIFGSAIYVDIEIAVDENLCLKKAHDIAHAVHDKLELCKELRIKHCNVHVNPSVVKECSESENLV